MRLPIRFSVSGLPFCDCLRTLVSAVLAAMGLFRDGFRLGGDADACEPDERVGEVDFLMGTGTGVGRTMAVGLTADGDRDPVPEPAMGEE